MIISASYRTDIPAFYSQWFISRLRSGSCSTVNPWNRKINDISLLNNDIDGFVFWTRNLTPLEVHLPEIFKHAPFYIQYTIIGYPRSLDQSVIEAKRAIYSFRNAANQWGARSLVWRYDPIVLTSDTPKAWHLQNFRNLARLLEFYTDEVTISFIHPYRKSKTNMNLAASKNNFTWRLPQNSEGQEITTLLAEIAIEHGMKLTICAQPQYASGISQQATCIDAERLSDISSNKITSETKGNRPGCLCHASRDIGAYETCPHGCCYCYAVSNSKRAKQRFNGHDSMSNFLGQRFLAED